jgi:hypothetical protein
MVSWVPRTLLAAAAFGSVTAAAEGAFAQDSSEVLGGRRRTFESPQNFQFEIRIGPYKPDVDSDPKLTGTPYEDVFGSTPRVLVAAEFDWQAFRIPYVGTIGPGIALGYTKMNAKAALTEPRPDRSLSDEETSLTIFPMYAVAVLRVDVFDRIAHIPLVPYGKAGIGFAFWRASNDAGTSSFQDPTTGQSTSGKGHTWGTQFALGLSLDLNVFDEYTARNFDNMMGVNHTYLFAEYYWAGLTGFGADDVLRVGSNTWTAGLSFDF